MAAPVFDDVACFDSLPDDLVGVIMSKLDFPSALRLTQACPTARRLVQGERAVPGVLGTVSVNLPRDVDFSYDLVVEVSPSGFIVREDGATTDDEAEAAAAGESHAEHQPHACIVHLLEWIRVRARAFTEIEINFEFLGGSMDYVSASFQVVLHHIADSFLPNVPSWFRGKISFKFEFTSLQEETKWEHALSFLAAWRALAPVYECGLTLDSCSCADVVLASLQAVPPLSSLTIDEVEEGVTQPGAVFLERLDTSRLTRLDALPWKLESLPSEDVLPPTFQDLSLSLCSDCWSSLGVFLAPLHRLTTLELAFDDEGWQRDSPLILAPLTVLPNLRLLRIWSLSKVLWPPAVRSDYWKEPVVLPALEELDLECYNDLEPQGEGEEPASQPSRWPTLLLNLEAPKLKRLDYKHWATDRATDHDGTLDLPLGRFPRLRYFHVSACENALLDLPALRAEIATLRHLQKPRPDDMPWSFSRIQFYVKKPVPEEEVKAWELELGFRQLVEGDVWYTSPTDWARPRAVHLVLDL